MPVTIAHRGRLVGFALLLFGTALAAMLFLEVPSLGIAYFLYLPVALAALATSPLSGAAAGVVAAELYALGEMHGSPTTQAVLSTTSALRLLTYTSIGALVGKFADDHRVLAARLSTLAERDPLTGLLNSRAHDAALTQRLAAAAPFALLLADVDDLKEVNDRQGHAAGNELLQRFASGVAGAVRRGDTVARIGGDEFAVLVKDAGAREADALCERLRELLAVDGLAASFGWAAWPDDGLEGRALFQRADERLYERKAARRLRSVARRTEEAGRTVPAESLG
jgi:diguanylate cyclase (GGDEF)-like protein